MNKPSVFRLVATFLTVTSLACQQAWPIQAVAAPSPQNASETPGAELQWPRVFQDGTTSISIYQPQIEKWSGEDFESRAAVSVQEAGQAAPVFGVVWLKARADVDKAAGILTLNDVQVTKASFPTEDAKADAYLAAIRKNVPTKSVPLALAQIENSFAISEAVQKGAEQPVQNTPPNIIFSTTPSLLVLVDGNPVLRPLNGTNYQRVLNSRALIVQNNGGGPFYLLALNRWYQSQAIEGPWGPTAKVPADLAEAKKAALATNQVDPLNPPKDQSAPKVPPTVYVSTVPTELVQTQGQPAFAPIEGTQLLEVNNSDNAIILDIQSQLYYVLISGRWFNSKAMTGPWSFVASNALPPEFAKIPPDSSKGNVLLSVAGTPEADEAVIANSIPQTATVNRLEAKLDVPYASGAPDFQPIEGTPLRYAVNSSVPVIEVAPNQFYSVQNGVWFVSNSPNGPWSVATEVPAVIYTIPVSCPIYYVTNVRVYGSTPDVVYTGYTPGYLGTVVAPDGCVVYGTGYYYPPYCGTTVYVGQPCTYGFGAGFAYGAVTGFAFGFAAGAVVGTCVKPWWGPVGWGWGYGYNYTHVSINNTNIYNHWGGGVATVSHSYGYNSWNGSRWTSNSAAGFNPYSGRWVAANNGHAYNPATGNYAAGRNAAVSNPRTGVTASGQTSVTGNRYTGNYNATQNREVSNSKTGASAQSSRQASGNAYTGNYSATTTRSGTTQNGAVAAGQKTTTGNVYTGQSSTSRTGAAYNPNTGKGVATKNGDVYAGSDGNVYKKTDNGWQHNTGSGWQTVDKTNANRTQELNRAQTSRQVGGTNYNNFQKAGGMGGTRTAPARTGGARR